MTIAVNLKTNPYYTGTKSLDGNTYQLTVHYNTFQNVWHLDLTGITNSVDIRAMAILPGKDLLARYGEVELGSLWLIDNSGANSNPNYVDIGGRFTLEYTPL